MHKFFIENEDDILAIVDDTGTKDTYQDIIETLIRNGLYSMCVLLCDLAVGNVMHAFFDDIYLDDLDATVATTGTSLKNQSLWSSNTTLDSLEKNYEARKTIKLFV